MRPKGGEVTEREVEGNRESPEHRSQCDDCSADLAVGNEALQLLVNQLAQCGRDLEIGSTIDQPRRIWSVNAWSKIKEPLGMSHGAALLPPAPPRRGLQTPPFRTGGRSAPDSDPGNVP